MLERQAYRLAYWRTAFHEINYRRFFDVNSLASLRVEEPAAFQESHRLLLDLLRSGPQTGVRLDHLDGLYDPGAYIHQLRVATSETAIIIEPGQTMIISLYKGSFIKIPEPAEESAKPLATEVTSTPESEPSPRPSDDIELPTLDPVERLRLLEGHFE